MTRFPRPLFPLIAVAVLLLAGCDRYDGPIGVDLERQGSAWISPGRTDGVQDSAALSVRVAQPYESMVLTAYAVAVYDTEGHVVWRGGDAREPRMLLWVIPRPVAVAVPPTLTWDGKLTDGGFAGDGRYTIVVDVWDSKRNTGRSGPVEVVVDNTPPRVDLFVESVVFSPDGDGRDDTLTIQQRNPTTETSWTAAVRDREGKTVRSWTWEGKTESVIWDGRTAEGVLLPDGTYTYTLASTDAAGNGATYTVEGITLRTRPEIETATWIQPVHFQPYTSSWTEGMDSAIVAANVASLDRAAALLDRFPELTVRVEGHAVRIHWDSPRLAPLEERVVLMPLSRKRAEAVRDALVERGVAAARISTVAQGGARPLVPHGDLAERWKNRRGEIYFLEPVSPEPAPAAVPEAQPDAQPDATPEAPSAEEAPAD